MPTMLSRPAAKIILNELGWNNAFGHFSTAVQGFQIGWSFDDELETTSGFFDQSTSDALRRSYIHLQHGRPTMSAHFSFTSFACHCGGDFPDCKRIWVQRVHVRRLEAYWRAVGGPVRIVSGCRCKRYNAKIGGASSSQHMFGAASDIDGVLTVHAKEKLQLFGGLGFKQSNNKVIHVDSRDKGGHNLTNGSQQHPTTWIYAS
ncbi:hypothetical protein GCM10027446_15660 [Angustibacter peucedani]